MGGHGHRNGKPSRWFPVPMPRQAHFDSHFRPFLSDCFPVLLVLFRRALQQHIHRDSRIDVSGMRIFAAPPRVSPSAERGHYTKSADAPAARAGVARSVAARHFQTELTGLTGFLEMAVLTRRSQRMLTLRAQSLCVPFASNLRALGVEY